MRAGGVSEGPYASLNLGSHVQDDLDKVLQNRALLFSALAPSLEESEEALIVPKQVHGDTVLTVGAAREVARVQRAAAEGADGSSFLRVRWERSCALLIACRLSSCCYGPFRGRACRLARYRERDLSESARPHARPRVPGARLSRSELAAQTKCLYRPYIHRECFETGADIHALFVTKFGKECRSMRRISIWELLARSARCARYRPARICDLDRCTVLRE